MNDIEKICVKKLPTYCKKCGKIIDDNTKICTGCGKNYFSIKRLFNNFLIYGVVLIILFCSMFYNLYQSYKIDQYKTETYYKNIELKENKINIDNANKKIEDLETQISDKNSLIDDYVMESLELGVYQEYLAFVTEDGKKYHKRSCSHIKNRNIYYDTIVNLQNQGYTPCKDCYP